MIESVQMSLLMSKHKFQSILIHSGRDIYHRPEYAKDKGRLYLIAFP